ncbi:LuxR family maltose regulon positive regulatory protein [Actinoplanes xinjiangensis]|jgi:LuxR family maltose regulon positive regulatory protein|uniref:LuxR family maltose regulon positive regulatory protein n=1 Tax=Actinoplanes xinjiangensis TaxID=512350 RepID=A0A316FE32_9ACTN|nr:LuxR family maltose regulon positive regulatory protein [Actinoplanes xinjiangensis]
MRERSSIGTAFHIPVDHTTPPRLPAGLIWRARLAAMLDQGVQQAVTLVCAGPGWGKTALVASWAAARSMAGPVAWLTLDDQHDDAFAFWSDLFLALHTAGALPHGHAVPASDADEAEYRQAVAAALALRKTPAVVVLDDLQRVTDPRILGGLAGLLRLRQARFVLLTRRESDLPLHRLRTGGELTEIRACDLGFRLEEAAELLAIGGRGMPSDRLAAIVRRTEGWSAGVRLLLDNPDPAHADDLVEDYMLREVLGAQPEEVRRFLLRTAVPDRICGELAHALTGERHSQYLLEDLTRGNLFVERTGGGRWFRYHPMLRAALRRRLARRWPDTPSGLHREAARWHDDDGAALPALAHAAAAADWDLVARIVVRRGLPLFTSGDRPQLMEVLHRIPVARLPETAELAVCAVMLAYARGDLASVPRRIAAIRSLLAGREDNARALVGTALAVLESGTVIRWQGDMPHLLRASTDLLTELSRLSWDQAPSLLQYRAMTLNNKGAALLWSGWFDHADRYLWAAVTASRTAGVPLTEVNALGLLAQLAVFQGSLGDAADHANAAVEAARRIDSGGDAAVAPAYLAQAMIESERGREPETEDWLRKGLHALGEVPEATQFVVAGTIRVRLMLDRGDTAGARSLLGQVRAESGPPLSASQVDRILDLAGAEIRLASGDPAAVVMAYGSRVVITAAEQVLLARALLATGNLPVAATLLGRVRDGSDRVSATAAWILTALAADTQGRSSVASEALAQALAAAEPERIRRPFRTFDVNRVMVLAERQHWLTELRGPAGDGVLGEITGEIPIISPTPSAGPLSEREVDVLQYLPTVLTAGEIAENLGISVNTVKAHMRSIYRKLGAARRREAVVTARQSGLI